MFSSPPSFLLLIFHFSYFPKCRTEHRETEGRSRQRWRFGGENTQSTQNLLFRLHSCNSVHSEVQEAGGKSCINKISKSFYLLEAHFEMVSDSKDAADFFSPEFPTSAISMSGKKETRRNSSSSPFFLFHGKTEYLGRRRKKWTKFNVSSLLRETVRVRFSVSWIYGRPVAASENFDRRRGKGVCIALAEEEN